MHTATHQVSAHACTHACTHANALPTRGGVSIVVASDSEVLDDSTDQVCTRTHAHAHTPGVRTQPRTRACTHAPALRTLGGVSIVVASDSEVLDDSTDQVRTRARTPGVRTRTHAHAEHRYTQ